MKQTEKDFLEHMASFDFSKKKIKKPSQGEIFHAVEKKEDKPLDSSLDEKDFSQSLGLLISSKLTELQNAPEAKVQEIIKLADLAERYFKSTGKFRKKGVPIHYQNFNLHFAPFFFSLAFYKIAYGGSGTGKSRALMSQYPLKRIIEEKDVHYLAVRKVEKTLELSVLADLMAVIKEEKLEGYLEISQNKAKPWIQSTTTGSRIDFMGLHDVDNLKSLSGITGFLVEEMDQLEESDFSELERRLRGGDDSKKEIVGCFNPTPRGFWLKKRFLDNPPESSLVLKCHYTHNQFLTRADIKRLEDMKIHDPIGYQIYTEGDFYSTHRQEIEVAELW